MTTHDEMNLVDYLEWEGREQEVAGFGRPSYSFREQEYFTARQLTADDLASMLEHAPGVDDQKAIDENTHLAFGCYLQGAGWKDGWVRRAGVEAIKKGLAVCESPIERLILPYLVFNDWSGVSAMPASVYLAGEDIPDAAEFYVVPQLPFGPYRLDFSLTRRNSGRVVTVAVECDGKDFHDAARDAERDRYCADRGVQTVRLTGSQIVRFPRIASFAVVCALRSALA